MIFGKVSRIRFGLGLAISAALIGAVALTRLILTNFNTLEHDGEWSSGKIPVRQNLTGAIGFITTRPALAGNELHLDTWFGLNEVTYDNHDLKPKRITFNFKLEGLAYLIFEYNRDETGFSGLRLSHSSRYPSAILKVGPDGEFKSKTPIAAPATKPGWNQLAADFSADAVHFSLNGQQIASDPNKPHLSQWIGLRGGVDPTTVSPLTIEQRDDLPTIKAGFSNTHGAVALFAISFLLLAGLGILPLLFLPLETPSLQFVPLLTELVILFALAAYSYADERWFASRYPSLSKNGSAQYPLEVTTTHSVVKDYPPHNGDPGYRILFVGSSQTWGAGTRNRSESFPEQAVKLLNADKAVVAQVGRVACMNQAVPGNRAAEQREVFETYFARSEPRIIVINLGNNDGTTFNLRTNLLYFVHYGEEHHVPVVLMLEANFPDAVEARLADNHEVIKELAKLHHLPLIDLHGYLMAHADDGLEWWDFVHMTSFGYRLTSALLAPTLRALILSR